MEKKIMLGNEAFARGAYEAGVKVISSYPGTPSTEVTEAAARYDEIHVEWAPNEKVGTEVAVGACIGGARALSCMKHVGLNVAADPFYTAAYTGVTGGLVILVADDNGCHSSQNEQDSRYHGKGAGVPVLEPANAQECKDFMKYAYELSEKYDTPVLCVPIPGFPIPEESLLLGSGKKEKTNLTKKIYKNMSLCRPWRKNCISRRKNA